MPPAELPGPVDEICGAILMKSVRFRLVVGKRDDRIRDVRPRAGVRRAELAAVHADHLHRAELGDLRAQTKVHDERLRERHLLIVLRLWLQSDASRRDRIRSAGLEVLDAVASIFARLRADGKAGGPVPDDDLYGGKWAASSSVTRPAIAPVVMP